MAASNAMRSKNMVSAVADTRRKTQAQINMS